MILPIALLAGVAAAQASDRILLIDNVNVRSRPEADAPVVCRERFGSELQVHGRAQGWVRVNSCGFDAWISEPLTRDVTDATRVRAREQLLRERLAHVGDSFSNADHLLHLVNSWAGASEVTRDREAVARYALFELQALRHAASAAEQNSAFRGTLMRRIGETSPELFYNEVGGSWMIRNDHIRAVHDKFKDTAAADDIAWFAAENGVGGECEGDPGCHATVANLLFGEYLRHHPAGKHRDEALKRIATGLGYGSLDATYLDDRKELCGRMMTPLTALRTAVSKTTGAGTSQAIRSIERLSAVCR